MRRCSRSGERPEDRYEVARDWLSERGYDSTVHYVAEMAKLVLAEDWIAAACQLWGIVR